MNMQRRDLLTTLVATMTTPLFAVPGAKGEVSGPESRLAAFLSRLGCGENVSAVETANLVRATGTLTPKVFDAFSAMSFRHGSAEKLLLSAPIIRSAINEWGRNYLMVRPAEKMLGVIVQQVLTPHGAWLVANDWRLEAEGSAISIDIEAVSGKSFRGDCHAKITGVTDYANPGSWVFMPE